MEIIQLSNRLVEYRKSNNMTIKEFSELSGISTALLSQLERGVGNPSLSVLNAISETMNTSLSSLFEEPVILENLVRRSDGLSTIVYPCRDNLEFQLLTTRTATLNINLVRIVFHAHSETSYQPLGKNISDDVIHIEKGSLTVQTDDGKSILLKKGDTLRIPPDLRYKFKNISVHNVVMIFATNKLEVR